MKGAEIDTVFCSYSTDDCATVDEYPGRNTHSEMRFDQVVEELAKTPGREVRGEIRRLGDLGYLIFNDLLWADDWKTFPIGADLEDHRMGRPIADALMGHDSAAWSTQMIHQSAVEFFEGRNSLNLRDMTMWCNKLLHKILLDMDITDEEESVFEDYKVHQQLLPQCHGGWRLVFAGYSVSHQPAPLAMNCLTNIWRLWIGIPAVSSLPLRGITSASWQISC